MDDINQRMSFSPFLLNGITFLSSDTNEVYIRPDVEGYPLDQHDPPFIE
jgi:hypothetical protein